MSQLSAHLFIGGCKCSEHRQLLERKGVTIQRCMFQTKNKSLTGKSAVPDDVLWSEVAMFSRVDRQQPLVFSPPVLAAPFFSATEQHAYHTDVNYVITAESGVSLRNSQALHSQYKITLGLSQAFPVFQYQLFSPKGILSYYVH